MATVYEERTKVFKALCDERRQRILELLHSGRAPKEIAKDLGLSTSTVRRWGEREGGG